MGAVTKSEGKVIGEAMDLFRSENPELSRRMNRRRHLRYLIARRQSVCSHEMVRATIQTVHSVHTGSSVMVKKGICRKCAKRITESVVLSEGDGAFDA